MKKKKYTRIAGGIVINPKGKVAVVSQLSGTWSLPKGHVESGERPKQTAVREIFEETGIPSFRLKLVKKLGAYIRPKVSKSGKSDYPSLLRRITIFLFTTDFSGKLSPKDVENPKAKWVKPDKVAERLTHPKDKKFFLSHLKEIKRLKKSARG